MQSADLRALPHMLYADGDGRIFDHPHLRIVGFSGKVPMIPEEADLMPMPKYSKLFFIPDCPPIGLDPDTGGYEVLSETVIDGVVTPCNAVAAFFDSLCAGDVRGCCKQVSDDLFILRFSFIDGRDMFIWDQQDMHWRRRIGIPECRDFLIPEDDVRWRVAPGNFAEDAGIRCMLSVWFK